MKYSNILVVFLTVLTLSTVQVSGISKHKKKLRNVSKEQKKRANDDQKKVNQDQAVGLNLETTLLFDPSDADNDLTVISKLKTVLDRLEKAVRALRTKKSEKYLKNGPKMYYGRSEKHNESGTVLTDFLANIGNVLQKYNDKDLKNISRTFEKEVNKLLDTFTLDPYRIPENVVYKRSMYDTKVKEYIKKHVHSWTLTDSEHLKTKIKKLVTNPMNNTITRLVKKLNFIFGKEDDVIFNKVTTLINDFPEDHIDLTPVIRKTLKYAVFDRFEHANVTHRDELLDFVYELTAYISNKQYKNTFESHSHHRRNLINEIFPSLKKSDEDFSDFKKTNDTKKSSLEKITQDSEPEDIEIPNEILIKKDMEINIKDIALRQTTEKVTMITSKIATDLLDLEILREEGLLNKNPETSDKDPETSDKNPETSDKTPQTSDKTLLTSGKTPHTSEKPPSSVANLEMSELLNNAETSSVMNLDELLFFK